VRALSLSTVVLGASLLCACGGVLSRPVDSVREWVGVKNDGRSEPAPGKRGACEAPSVPVPPPMADDTPAGPDEPIPAPCGPPPAAAWPPPRAACPAPGGTPSSSPGGGLPTDVTDVASARAWSLIVVHHSASKVGGSARFDEWHRAKGWEGVGYDFVIGNGTDTADGFIETTFRWREQKDGAHVKGWNEMAIGICLVGNFEETDPTPAQLDALRTLVRHLRGRFRIPRERVLGHGQLNATACPGKRFSVRAVAAATDPTPAAERGP